MGVSIARRRAGRYLALAALLLATPAAADGLTRWRTPNGSLYVGDSPPPGSTFLDRTTRPDPVSSGWADADEAAPDEAASAMDGEDAPAAAAEVEPVKAAKPKAPKELSPAEITQINLQLQGSADAVGGGRMPIVPPVPGQP